MPWLSSGLKKGRGDETRFAEIDVVEELLEFRAVDIIRNQQLVVAGKRRMSRGGICEGIISEGVWPSCGCRIERAVLLPRT